MPVEQIFVSIKDYFIYTVWYIYPYIVLYILYIIDNYILFFSIGGLYTIVLYLIHSAIAKEQVSYIKIFLFLITLPLSILWLTWKVGFLLINKFILYPLLGLPYPYIPLSVKKEIYEINEIKKLRERRSKGAKLL